MVCVYFYPKKGASMKKVTVIFSLITLIACNTQKKPNPNSEAANPIVNQGGDINDSSANGKRLIAASDCSGCHNLTTKLTGPPFMDISKRYPYSIGVAQNLARAIIDGSKGAWQTATAMPPHPTIRFNDAVKMAQYILSLRGQAKRDSLNAVR